ncbi:MAG: DUF3426 domain-containing protein [Methyloprofundus sp.]|nr:DUF3426 domain-containing protein [Methyloprofundus sp.]MDT8426411.1 DUF3426 domain-containing protein [Methyloprofundus sp.]
MALKNKNMIYAACSKCQNTQEISTKQLQKKHRKVICTQCKNPFNPRASLTNKPSQTIDNIDDNEIKSYAWQKPVNSHAKLWLISSLLGGLLLVYQVYYFKGYSLAQSAQIRPWLATITKAINTPLPPYKNIQEFTTIGSSFTPIENDNFRLQVSFINHANFSQALPNLSLTLQNLHGGIIAQRLFTPKDYLRNNQTPTQIASNSALDIDLLMAIPNKNIGGYQVALQ